MRALKELGETATTRQIAERTELHVNGVSQSLGALCQNEHVNRLDGEGGEARWELRVPSPLTIVQGEFPNF